MGSDRQPLGELPGDRAYDPDHHTWALHDETTGRVRVGVDALATESLGELAHVSLEPIGTIVERGGLLGTLEAAKMTSSVAAPVGGELVARNEEVLADPTLLNRDPYGSGWLVELMTGRWTGEGLLTGAAAQAWAAEAAERLAAES